MTLRWLLATIHLAGLVIGATAILTRARNLTVARDTATLRPVFLADNWWGVSGALLLATGIWRAFGGLEKGSAYYLGHSLFYVKLGLFVLVLLLELWPMITLVRWRAAVRRGEDVDLRPARAIARISYGQLSLLGVILVLATAIARGIGF